MDGLFVGPQLWPRLVSAGQIAVTFYCELELEFPGG